MQPVHGFSFKKISICLITGLLMTCVSLMASPPAQAKIIIVAFGDSLTAGYNLPASAAFPNQLEKALLDLGLDVEVVNAGVSGDTTSGGLQRLDWSIPDHANAVILELGANDMLRGLSPQISYKNLDEMITRLKARKISILLAGMLAAPDLGKEYSTSFNAIYPDLAQKHDVFFYPFFMDSLIGRTDLLLQDGMHPTTQGVALIVKNILPTVKEMLAALKK